MQQDRTLNLPVGRPTHYHYATENLVENNLKVTFIHLYMVFTYKFNTLPHKLDKNNDLPIATINSKHLYWPINQN